jgi:ATP-dependent DNA helicase DinG
VSDYLDDVFGPGGLLARRFSGYEARPGQVALARTIDRAMREGRHMLGEGPCGTGKSLAYGVPAAHRASGAAGPKARVVIATANIALQEQLIKKDLPLLAEILPWPFTYALLKGKNNFYCLDKADDAERTGYFADLRRGGHLGDDRNRAADQLGDLLEWAAETETGDKSELPFVPVESLWSRVSPETDECKAKLCAQYKDPDGELRCHFYRAQRAAHAADVIVTNYHVLFAHLKVRDLTGKEIVLPHFDYLVLDEAHEAADVARDFFGFEFGHGAVRRVATYARRHLPDGRDVAAQLLDESERFFAAVARYESSPAYSIRLRAPGWIEEPTALLRLLDSVLSYAAPIAVMEPDSSFVAKEDIADARNVVRRAEALALRITESITLEDANKVYYIERDRGGSGRLGAKLIDVAEELRAFMFDGTHSVSLTSATLTTEGTFAFVRRELGVPDDALECVAATPFDFGKQALLVVPTSVPSPDDARFAQYAAESMLSVVEQCGGRTLCLFTSNKNLSAVHERMRGAFEHTLLRQGEQPRTELARVFKEDVNSVLLGTNSFWVGIDVPGEALTGLVIDKLPFPNRSDAVIDALCARDPQNWFKTVSMPRAIMMLRQGVGRLIRAQTDVGVVVILDRRLVDKFYKTSFYRSLPAMGRSCDLDDVGRFLRGEPLLRQAAAPPAPVAARSLLDL